jgi:phenylacetate-CoA ligase
MRSVFLTGRQREIARKRDLYDRPAPVTEIARAQVDGFNRIWRHCVAEVPFYQRWSRTHGLPERITRLADLADFPVLRKRDVVDHEDEIFQHGRIKDYCSTGGSTGTPMRFPRQPRDTLDAYANLYVGRGWWGLRPFDSFVHLWGHAHLFSTRPHRWLIKARRALADRFVNGTRLNAYDQSEAAVRSHYRAVIARDATYLVGFTSTLFKLARFMQSEGLAPPARLRAVVVTAEMVTPAEVELIETAFRVPVVVEYGAGEVGVIAVSRGQTWPLQVFWDSVLVRPADGGGVRLTTLNDRLFPLINYDIGDLVDIADGDADTVIRIASVRGRQQDVIRVSSRDGATIELLALMPIQILKYQPGIVAVQFRQDGPGRLRIFLQMRDEPRLSDVAAVFTREVLRYQPTFDPTSVTFELVDEPALTPAGKHRLFVP